MEDPVPETATQDGGAGATRETVITRLRRSFDDSFGSIVFGMEDGTVSIFGLVFGVAASAPDAHTVLLAGATGAAAAAVSMMAGTYLDVESANDKAEADLADERERLADDPDAHNAAVKRRLLAAGFGASDADTVIEIANNYPETALEVSAAVDLGIGDATRRRPLVQAAWMFSTDLFAASVPVIPFAFFALGTARLVSVIVTLVLLLGLGIGRAAVGKQRVLPTVIETIGIAAAAAVAGVAIGKLVS